MPEFSVVLGSSCLCPDDVPTSGCCGVSVVVSGDPDSPVCGLSLASSFATAFMVLMQMRLSLCSAYKMSQRNSKVGLLWVFASSSMYWSILFASLSVRGPPRGEMDLAMAASILCLTCPGFSFK